MKEHLILSGKLVLQAKIDLFSPEQFTFKVFEIEQVILPRFFWHLKIRRGPKLEGYAFANFGYSSGTVEVVL